MLSCLYFSLRHSPISPRQRHVFLQLILAYDACYLCVCTRTIPHPKGMQHCPLEGVEKPQGSPVGGDQDEFPIVAELESCPFTSPVIMELEGSKRTLKKKKKKTAHLRTQEGTI